MKYLHLINDTLFTNFAEQLFETCNPGNNVFLVGVKDDSVPVKNTRLKEHIHVRRIRSKGYYEFLENNEFDVLVVHFMHDYKSAAINRLKKQTKIIWLVWGGDIHGSRGYTKSTYQPLTLQALNGLDAGWKKKVRSSLRSVYYYLVTGGFPEAAYKRAVAKVNYCATVIPDEFELLAAELPFFHATKVPFAYATIEDNLKGIGEEDYATGNGILVGNSMDATSNHLDAFDKLAQLNVRGRRIIAPLNYGEGLNYREIVLQKGQAVFGEAFTPLLQLLPSVEYTNVLKGCSVAIMNHERQQAVGNIISLLWLGVKIFMSDNSIVFSYLRKNGFKIYSVQRELAQEIDIPLTREEIALNRSLLRKEYGREEVLNKTRTLMKIVENHDNGRLPK